MYCVDAWFLKSLKLFGEEGEEEDEGGGDRLGVCVCGTLAGSRLTRARLGSKLRYLWMEYDEPLKPKRFAVKFVFLFLYVLIFSLVVERTSLVGPDLETCPWFRFVVSTRVFAVAHVGARERRFPSFFLLEHRLPYRVFLLSFFYMDLLRLSLPHFRLTLQEVLITPLVELSRKDKHLTMRL